ncbi:PIG-L family deacetylase [Kribbella sancticallisti]|uniref:PIG-L family deacetylase n=1 Tax=Kribbella sancticallisti TaxID=460087 RepID=A0ABN2EXD4_9ACTN
MAIGVSPDDNDEVYTLAVVVAHPDDDAYGIAGTVALHAAEDGFRFVLVHATDGEGGDIRPGFPATPETLGRIRRAEDEAAWRAVGRSPDRHVWLGYQDGEVDRAPFDELVDAVWAVLEEEQPAVVFTFGPDGIFGHPDHIAIGAATDAAFTRGAALDGPAFRRLLHGAVPESVFRRWNTQRADLGLTVFDPTLKYHMRGVPDEDIGVVVDCREVADRIVSGLLEHRSQHHVMSDDPDDVARWQRVVSREWHVVAWPPRGVAKPHLTDVFQGLT